MPRIINVVLEQIFPTFYARRANKLLKNKINSADNQSNVPYMDNIDDISIEYFKEKYNETFEIKNKFEDKAKTNVIGITIAITVIMGASGLTGSLINKYSSVVLHWISFSILLLAIIYLLLSGIQAIKVLFQENTMSTVDLSDISKDENKMKEKYDDCINRNINRNISRNNIVFSSYICIRNALICMMALFCLITIPLPSLQPHGSNACMIPLNESSISYSSTINIPDGISITDINESVIQDKTGRKAVEDGSEYGFINLDKKYYVQYKCFGSDIIIERVSCFDNVMKEP